MKLPRGYILPLEVVGPDHYRLFRSISYYSKRYNKTVTAPAGFEMDGATGATDITTRGWIFHDWLTASGLNPDLKGTKHWDDGTPCSRWQSSVVLYDCLREDGYVVRAPFWCLFTWAIDPLG